MPMFGTIVKKDNLLKQNRVNHGAYREGVNIPLCFPQEVHVLLMFWIEYTSSHLEKQRD